MSHPISERDICFTLHKQKDNQYIFPNTKESAAPRGDL